MNKDMSGESEIERIEQEAAKWLWKTDRGLTGEEQDLMLDWLTEDARHFEIFEKQKASWTRLNGIASWKPEHSDHPNPDLLAPKANNRWKNLYRATIGLAACFIFFTIIMVDKSVPEEVNTPLVAVNETLEHLLEDGSVIFSKGNSDFEVKYSSDERRILMRSGEIYFDVFKDRNRPFIVETNGVEFRALGTAFNVRVTSDTMELLVEEGTVQLANSLSPQTPKTDDAKMISLENEETLVAGQQAIVELDVASAKPEVETLSETQVKQRLSWQHRKLHFSGERLDEVILEFNRLNDQQIEIADANVSSVEISGSIQSDNIEGFLRLLELGFQVYAEKTEEKVLLYGIPN